MLNEIRSRLASPALRGGLPVLPGHLPVVGHALTLHRDAVPALQRAARDLGPAVQVHLGFGQWYLFLFGADTFELLRHKSVAVKGSRGSLDYLLGRSLLTLDGPPHRSVRAVMNPSFSGRGLGESGAEAIVAETVERHVRRFVESGGGDVHAPAQAMALDVIFRIAGVDVESLADFHAQYRRAFWGLIPLPVEWPGTPRYFALKAVAWIDERLAAMVRRARETDGESLLHALVRARDEQGRPLTDRELVDNLRLLFIAGHETTATTMTWATLHLAERPDLVERLKTEVRDSGVTFPLSIAEARKLPLCEGVFREAVRLYTPAWFIERMVTEDLDFRGHTLPKGTAIAVVPPLWGRDPDLYPNPERFEPDRWVGRSSAPTMIELSAFGGGAHFCLGYHLSWLESVTYVALLARTLAEGRKLLRPMNPRGSKVAYFPMPHPSPPARVAVVQA